MQKRRWITFGMLVAGLGLLHALTAPSYSQRADMTVAEPLEKRLAKKWGMKEEDVRRRLEELGQEIQQDLAAGQAVEVRGLGTVRVVRVHKHRETVAGRPVVVDYKNTIQLVPAGPLQATANTPGARPAEEILPADYFFHDLPYGAAGLDRTQEFSTGSARPAQPSNKPSQKAGGRRGPER